MRKLVRQPLEDVAACLYRLAESGHPGRTLGIVLVSLLITWFIYVPIHEMLHVLGCVVSGGSVSKLEIAPHYGGALLAQWFPFIVSGGDYAGRLSGFDTKGSDLIYLATDFGPFVLSVIFGVPLLRMCAKRRRPILLGVGVVVGLAPFYNLIGDYYEMGSVITTRVATIVGAGGGAIAFEGIRSDDIFKLIGSFLLRPGDLGLHGAGTIAVGAILAAVSMALAVILSLVTYALGHGVACLTVGSGPARADHNAGE